MKLTDPLNGHQTAWACGPNGEIWYAHVHADVYDEIVIENAKRIVDIAVPQKRSTFFGGHYYSFVTREYLLNLLLFYHQDYGVFPTGSVCIVNQWVWSGIAFKRQGKWFSGWFWRFGTHRDELREPGYWVLIPSLEEISNQPITTPIQPALH